MPPKTFYTAEEADEVLFEDRGEFQAHLIPGILYVIVTVVMIFIVIILK